ncbi:MAG: preprotein translocase subunit SecE [Candidatus Paceibacterota bacterium]
MVLKIKTFFKESFSELKRVNWPTRKETTRLTIVVIVLSLVLAAMLGVFDYIFSYLLELLIVK